MARRGIDPLTVFLDDLQILWRGFRANGACYIEVELNIANKNKIFEYLLEDEIETNGFFPVVGCFRWCRLVLTLPSENLKKVRLLKENKL